MTERAAASGGTASGGSPPPSRTDTPRGVSADTAAASEAAPEAHDARRQGLGMLRWALGGLAAFLVGASGWILWRAYENPDVRLKPQWVPEGEAFDHSFWSPLLATVVVGSLLVGWILWRAFRRLRAGEDLYAGRFGRGVRRRGEEHLGDGDPG